LQSAFAFNCRQLQFSIAFSFSFQLPSASVFNCLQLLLSIAVSFSFQLPSALADGQKEKGEQGFSPIIYPEKNKILKFSPNFIEKIFIHKNILYLHINKTLFI